MIALSLGAYMEVAVILLAGAFILGLIVAIVILRRK